MRSRKFIDRRPPVPWAKPRALKTAHDRHDQENRMLTRESDWPPTRTRHWRRVQWSHHAALRTHS